MTPSALLELVDLIYNSYKRGQSLIKLNRFITPNKTNIKVYDLRHRFRCVLLWGLAEPFHLNTL